MGHMPRFQPAGCEQKRSVNLQVSWKGILDHADKVNTLGKADSYDRRTGHIGPCQDCFVRDDPPPSVSRCYLGKHVIAVIIHMLVFSYPVLTSTG